MPNVVIVDSGSANLGSISKALEKAAVTATISDNPAVITAADGIVFPGVGAFEHAMKLLREKELPPALLKVIAAGKPFLGICLGMQLLFSASEECGRPQGPLPGGLDAIPGQVKRFPAGLPVPHVGWNRVAPRYPHPLFSGLPDDSYFYFTHSFYVQPADPSHSLAQTEYGRLFTSAASRNNLLGVQFHPEKSGPAGLRLLSNFGKIIADPTLLGDLR
ncbi:MAG: imidazole glycerol phosphate synthase subunit HisH [Bacillota bacterium]